MPVNASSPQRGVQREVILVLAFCAFFFLWGLNSFGLSGADEPRYAQVAREMLARHDWVTPWLYGHPWLEKPVLYYWGAMLSYKVFGVSDGAARLGDGVMASLMALGVYGMLRRIRPAAALDAALILASTAAIFGFARGADTDMPLTAFFTLGMVAWFVWYETGSGWGLLAHYFFIAIATLGKGPVAAAFAGLIVVAFAAWRRDWRLVLRTLWIPGILLFLVTALPWYILVQLRNPQFFREFIIQHNLERFGTNLYHHRQPFWYYLPILLGFLLPWTVIALAALRDALRRSRHESGAGRPDEWPAFLMLWAILPVVFFSLSQSKLPGYILPAIPAWSLLAADYLARKREENEGLSRTLVVTQMLVVAFFVAAALLSPYTLVVHPMMPPLNARMIAGGLALATFYLGVRMSLRRGVSMLVYCTLVPMLLSVAFLVRVALPSGDAVLSARQPAARLVMESNQTVAVYDVHRSVEYGLAFYLDHPVARYDRAEMPEVPAGEHVLVMSGKPENVGQRIQAVSRYVGERRITLLGTDSPQELLIFRISAAK
jgi:4-amino-4-deoxy-L-arabinose transferase-like glycosyltransferase